MGHSVDKTFGQSDFRSIGNYMWLRSIRPSVIGAITERGKPLIPYKPHKAIIAILSRTLLSRGSYGVYVAITACTWLLQGGTWQPPRSAM